MRLRQDSLYRYHVPRRHVDHFIEQTDQVLQDISAAWEEEVETSLQEFLFRLEKELGATVEVSPEALFWMRDNVALVLASSDSPQDYERLREELLRETLHLLQ